MNCYKGRISVELHVSSFILEIPNDPLLISQILIGHSILSQKYLSMIVWHQVIMRKLLCSLTCFIMSSMKREWQGKCSCKHPETLLLFFKYFIWQSKSFWAKCFTFNAKTEKREKHKLFGLIVTLNTIVPCQIQV